MGCEVWHAHLARDSTGATPVPPFPTCNFCEVDALKGKAAPPTKANGTACLSKIQPPFPCRGWALEISSLLKTANADHSCRCCGDYPRCGGSLRRNHEGILHGRPVNSRIRYRTLGYY